MLKSLFTGLSVVALLVGSPDALASPIKIAVSGQNPDLRLSANTNLKINSAQIQATGAYVAKVNGNITFQDSTHLYGNDKAVTAWVKVTQVGSPVEQQLTGPATRIGTTNQFKFNVSTADNVTTANGNTQHGKGLSLAQNTDAASTTVQLSVATYTNNAATQAPGRNLDLPGATVNLASVAQQ